MPQFEDHDYLKICSKIASSLSISIAAARKKVEMRAAREGVKDIASRKVLAEDLLKEATSNDSEGDQSNALRFDKLLTALAEDENFMVED
tara:strand:- start:616 stop:885 length:270 start_codon:yes stop_codon:yes gene_type:complete